MKARACGKFILAMNSRHHCKYMGSRREFCENCSIAISKQKESLLKERERLMGEVETVRQRMKNMSAYAQELERKSSETEQRMDEMHDTIEMQLNEITREKKGRERAEAEGRQLQEEVAVKKNELEVRQPRKIIKNRNLFIDTYIVIIYRNSNT